MKRLGGKKNQRLTMSAQRSEEKSELLGEVVPDTSEEECAGGLTEQALRVGPID